MNHLVVIRTHEDMKWWAQGTRNNWELPPPANWFLRRFCFRVWRHGDAIVAIHAQEKLGWQQDYERWIAHAIWRGWC